MNVDRVEVLDTQGRIVMRVSSIIGTGSVDVSELKSGLYVLRCNVGGRMVAQRFVKN